MQEMKTKNKHIHWLMENYVGKEGRAMRVNVCFHKLRSNHKHLDKIRKLNRSMEIDIKNFDKLIEKLNKKNPEKKENSEKAQEERSYTLHCKSDEVESDKVFLDLITNFDRLTAALISVSFSGGFPNKRVVHKRISVIRKKMTELIYSISMGEKKGEKK